MRNINADRSQANFYMPTIKDGHCPKCGGMGYLAKDICHFCYGTGLTGVEWTAELTSGDIDLDKYYGAS